MPLSLATRLLFLGTVASASPFFDETLDPFNVLLMGDSYMSGVGARNAVGQPDYYSIPKCRRSPSNAGVQYAQTLATDSAAGADRGIAVQNRACSGGHIPSLYQERLIGTVPKTSSGTCPASAFPLEEIIANDNATSPDCNVYVKPQVDAITDDTDLILLTIGGNDVGFLDLILYCILPGMANVESCSQVYKEAADMLQSPTFQTEVEQALTELVTPLTKDGDKVVLASYPYLVLDNNYTLVDPKTHTTLEAGNMIRKLGDMGDVVQKAAVEAVNKAHPGRAVFYDKTKSLFAGHEPNAKALSGGKPNPNRWISQIGDPNVDFDEFYHPNAKGYAEWAKAFAADGLFGAARRQLQSGDPSNNSQHNMDSKNTKLRGGNSY